VKIGFPETLLQTNKVGKENKEENRKRKNSPVQDTEE